MRCGRAAVNAPHAGLMKSQLDSMAALWESHWSGHAHSSTGQRSTRFAREAFSALMAFVENRDRRVLDVGCGTGRFAALLAVDCRERIVIGADISANSLLMGATLKRALDLDNLSFVR